jgi:hypothetical protein
MSTTLSNPRIEACSGFLLEDLRRRLQLFERIACELLEKNQQLRMALQQQERIPSAVSRNDAQGWLTSALSREIA